MDNEQKKYPKEAQPLPGEPEEDDVKNLPYAEDLNEIIANSKEILEDEISYKGKKYKIRFRRIPWELYNQVVEETALETTKNPAMAERVEQAKLMRMILYSINDIPFDERLVNKLDSEFGEALRYHLFETSGKNYIPRQMMGELMEKLEPSIMKSIESEQEPKRGRSLISKSALNPGL